MGIEICPPYILVYIRPRRWVFRGSAVCGATTPFGTVKMSQVSVTINRRQFRMACEDGQENNLMELARELDVRIESLRAKFGEIDDPRLTVMAALTVADELAEMGKRLKRLEAEVEQRHDAGHGAEALVDQTTSETTAKTISAILPAPGNHRDASVANANKREDRDLGRFYKNAGYTNAPSRRATRWTGMTAKWHLEFRTLLKLLAWCVVVMWIIIDASTGYVLASTFLSASALLLLGCISHALHRSLKPEAFIAFAICSVFFAVLGILLLPSYAPPSATLHQSTELMPSHPSINSSFSGNVAHPQRWKEHGYVPNEADLDLMAKQVGRSGTMPEGEMKDALCAFYGNCRE